MSLKKEWKTTNRPDGPTGRKRKGTFRDVSFRFYEIQFIDDADFVCIHMGLKRSELQKILAYRAHHEPLLLFAEDQEALKLEIQSVRKPDLLNPRTIE